MTALHLIAHALVGIVLLACSTPKPPQSGGCTAYFSGDVTDTVSVPQCAALGFDADAGAYTLGIDVVSGAVGHLQVAIGFSGSPTGTFSSDTVPTWSAVTTVGADACALGAGSAAIPGGSFTLSIQSASSADGATALHGTLDLVLYVHAPPLINCGPHDVENIEVRF